MEETVKKAAEAVKEAAEAAKEAAKAKKAAAEAKKAAEKTVEEKMYKESIKAYDFHIGRYNTWMNLYAIFVGAFFIAYYNLGEPKDSFLQIIIGLMGLIASICWLGSFHGYYSWMLSWIRIVHYHEGLFLKKEKEKGNIKEEDRLRLYSLICIDNVKKRGYSTQKITLKFIWAVIVAWALLLINTVHSCYAEWMKNSFDCWCIWLCSIATVIIILAIIAVIICCLNKGLLSTTDYMYQLETKNNKYKVNDPEKKTEYDS